MRCAIPLIALVLAATPALPAPAVPFGGLSTDYSYVELADMALAAPLVVAARVRRATLLKGEAAAGVPAGKARYLVTADVQSLVRGKAEVPAAISYLVDVPVPPSGGRPKLKNVDVLVLGDLAGRPGEFRLVGPRAQIPRSAENEARMRAILTASVAPDAPPAVTGITRAFHVAGSLPGEGESQIFVRTADGRPISLNVLRRPGEQPRWAVALSELVDDSAAPPPRDSLLWYRLACGLPRDLPRAATDAIDPADAEQARADYAVVLAGLGSCDRDQNEDSSTPTPAQSG